MSGSKNEPSIDEMFSLIDLYFAQDGVSIQQQLQGFNHFIEKVFPYIIQSTDNVFFEKVTLDYSYRYRLTFDNFEFRPPTMDNGEKEMYPYHAMVNRLNYFGDFFATVTQWQDVINIHTGDIVTKMIGQPEKEVPIAKIPVMVRSKYCNLTLKPETDVPYTKYDRGGYFIVKGNEKVVLTVEAIIHRKILVLPKKEQNVVLYQVQVSSRPYQQYVGNVQSLGIKQKKDDTIVLNVLQFKEVPIFIFLKALGVTNDEDLIKMIVYDENDKEMINKVMKILSQHKNQYELETSQVKVITRADAIDFLINSMKSLRAYSDTDVEAKKKQKEKHLMKILVSYMLPHVTAPNENDDLCLRRKAFFICRMINKLLMCVMKRIEFDDRDSNENKRFEITGILLGQLAHQNFKKLLNECKQFFTKKNYGGSEGDANPINIINGAIKPTTIEQGLKQALAKGEWDTRSRKGFAQMLNRSSLLQTTSYMRRIITAMPDPSNNKIQSIRHFHPTQYGYISAEETPEGAKTGTVKNFSLMATVTHNLNNQAEFIHRFLIDENKIILLEDIPLRDIKKYIAVFLNGEWIGFVSDAYSLREEMREMKFNGIIDKHVGLVFDRDGREFKIYTEGGRLIRPLLVVNNLELVFKPEMLDGIKTWKDFMEKYPRVIEYVDLEECVMNCLIADFPSKINEMKEIFAEQEKTGIDASVQYNRYGKNVFCRYTHCEFHPSMVLGVVSTNVPFPDHNHGIRCIYNYAQARHSMGVYMLDYRHRIDNSYILFNSQLPIITTRASKYTDTHIMPAGTNIIVAIATYTAYNQNDSQIMNRSSLEKGLFSAASLKKYNIELDKNQSSSQVHIFMNPYDERYRDKVGGLKQGSYEKLNSKGYVDEETKVYDTDIIIGEGAPVPPEPGSDIIYKDESHQYRGTIPAVVNKVYADTTNQDGYPAMTMSLRQLRHPVTGDKFCSRHGQKGTIGNTYHRADMPFTESGLIPDMILNPHAFPKRMTIGQLIEMLLAKLCLAKGQAGDGTPYVPISIDAINKELEARGFGKYGKEVMYNGFTGQKMETLIFIAPVYYFRLKHMVNDKVHSRDRGPVQVLTRAPTEGRSRDGGLRFGEMERDAMIAHGTAQMLKERLLDCSDPHLAHVCDLCGFFAHRAKDHDYYTCASCNNSTRVSKLIIPYAFKLLCQEMYSMGIMVHLRTRKSLRN